MAKQIWKNASVKYKDSGGTTHTLDAQVQSVTLNYSRATNNTPDMTQDTDTVTPALRNWSVQVTFYQDFSSSAEIDSVLFDEVAKDPGNNGEIEIVPDRDSGVSASNPAFYGSVWVTDYPPFGGSVGDTLTTQVTFSPSDAINNGDLTRNSTSQI